MLAAGQVHDHVGPADALRGGDGGLHVEVAPVDEARRLDDAPQLGLAPHAARAVGAERGRERLGRGAQPLLGLGGAPELLAQLAGLLPALLLQLVHLRLHLLEALGDRAEGGEHAAVLLGAGDLGALDLAQPGLQLRDAVLLLADLLAEVGLLGVEPLAVQRVLRLGALGVLRGGLGDLLLGEPLRAIQLLAQRLDRGLRGGEARGLARATRRIHPGAGARHGEPDHRAHGQADDEADEQGDDGIHACSVPAASDTAGTRVGGWPSGRFRPSRWAASRRPRPA